MNLNLIPALHRRTFLRGTGAVIALPFLEAMTPCRLMGAVGHPAKPPVRLVFIHTESGMWMDAFKSKAFGRHYALTPTLEPLTSFKDDVSVCTGLFQGNHSGPLRGGLQDRVERWGRDEQCFYGAQGLH